MKEITFRYKLDSQAVLNHLNTIQTVIQRMSNGSFSCKTWSITLISGLLVILIEKGKIELISITTIPNVLFWLLDAYYLFLERRFRNYYNDFVKKLNYQELTPLDLQISLPKDNLGKTFIQSVLSFSVSVFHSAILIIILFVKQIF